MNLPPAPPPPPTGHYPIACSSADRRVNCAGSRRMESRFPDPGDSEASREGTAAHWVFSELRNIKDATLLPECAPNGVVVTPEMLDGADLLNGDIDRTIAGRPDAEAGLRIEETLAMPHIHPENGGTPDAWCWVPSTQTLYLWDYKFGFEYVEVVRNWQLINYAAGALRAVGVDGLDDQRTTVVFRIVQPRYYHSEGPVREWRVRASDLRGDFNLMRSQYLLSDREDAPLSTGGHCTYCQARHACPAFNAAARRVLEYTDRAPETEELDDIALGVELRILEEGLTRVKSRFEALKADAEARVSSGRAVAGWGLQPTYGHKKWTVPAEEVAMLGDLFGVDLRKPMDVITPTQAINKKHIDESVIKSYCEVPRTGVKLVRSENSLAMRAFKKVN